MQIQRCYKTDEFQNKYTYAMMSADFSAQTADALDSVM